MNMNKKITWVLCAILILVLPFLLQPLGNAWIRIADTALLYVLLAVGLNIVVGYTGLLDLGYIGFFAIGAYFYGLTASSQLIDAFPALASYFPNGLHLSIWIAIPASAVLAGIFGIIFGAPTLKLRGDYLAIVTLGFGEIVRVSFIANRDQITRGSQGIGPIDGVSLFGLDFNKTNEIAGIEVFSLSQYYYLFLLLVVFTIIVSHRLEFSRIGRAWMAIREDEIAAKAMGINTRNMKLLAFAMGATFGGVSGTLFSAVQVFIAPESFILSESIVIVAMVVLGGVGHLPGVVLGAVLLSILPEGLRFISGPLQSLTGGRIDASILRQLLIALAMISIMLIRPKGLWPSPEHGKSLKNEK